MLRRCAGGIVEGWLARAKQSSELNVVPLSDEQRAVHVPRLVEDMALRLSRSSDAMEDSDAIFSAAAVAHGKLRYLQGYTPTILVDESRIMEVTVFGMLQSNLDSLDFSLLLPDVTAIADEVDGQLTLSLCYVQPNNTTNYRLKCNDIRLAIRAHRKEMRDEGK